MTTCLTQEALCLTQEALCLTQEAVYLTQGTLPDTGGSLGQLLSDIRVTVGQEEASDTEKVA